MEFKSTSYDKLRGGAQDWTTLDYREDSGGGVKFFIFSNSTFMINKTDQSLRLSVSDSQFFVQRQPSFGDDDYLMEPINTWGNQEISINASAIVQMAWDLQWIVR